MTAAAGEGVPTPLDVRASLRRSPVFDRSDAAPDTSSTVEQRRYRALMSVLRSAQDVVGVAESLRRDGREYDVDLNVERFHRAADRFAMALRGLDDLLGTAPHPPPPHRARP